MRKDYRQIMRDNAVTILFVVMCILSILCSGQSLSYVALELFGRITRNAFLVLALIIPIVAGMGINFAVTIGAMAAQIAALWVTEWQIPGIGGFLTAAAISVPLAAFFGFLIGKLLNKMKGQEMIGGMILGYFANGLYQLLFLFIFGNLIPLKTDGLVIKGSTGVANTIELRGFKQALDGLWRCDFTTALYICAAVVIVLSLLSMVLHR
ncbi:MAG: ABC transporter permease, partial [Clostridia bacterium]|nr:ABC transporter permease [Clostridia bacterium]